MQYLVDGVILMNYGVRDQLSRVIPASLYKAFAPAEAKRILNKLSSLHSKHGGLSMAEGGLSVLSS